MSEILEKLKQAVINYDEEAVRDAAYESIEKGVDAFDAVFIGLVPGIVEVGRLYEVQEYFVPEMLMCADALYIGLEILKPLIKKKNYNVKGQVIIGVVEGDVHDIGKNIVKMMFEVAGFEVHDLGRNVPMQKFVEEQLRTDSELVLLSALMTTTMVEMETIIKAIKAKNPNVKIMVGGAPITKHMASVWGADGYAQDASNALKSAINMISAIKTIATQ
ncbi:MAG: corrinoid protein [Clostridia bacterium]|nr:corrinoid protein [Clostridia bacterium]